MFSNRTILGLCVFKFPGFPPSERVMSHSRPCLLPGSVDHVHTRAVITDLTIGFCSSDDTIRDCSPDSSRWIRLTKELYLHTTRQTAWLLIAQAREGELTADDLVVTDVRVSELEPSEPGHGWLSGEDLTVQPRATSSWERRPGGIWVERRKYMGNQRPQAQTRHMIVTGIDLLFGVDAIDPRPQWTLLQQPLQLPDAQPEVPVPRLTVRYSSSNSDLDEPHLLPRRALRAREDGTFKIVQISDTHMVTGVGKCGDAMDAHGQPLPANVADPLTVAFLGAVLDLEKPDLVILAGDQLHHDIHDSQTALFKVVAPLIERRIPYAAVFGNHDAEGEYALSREEQMSLLQTLPFSLSQPGPKEVDGVGNYNLPVLPYEKGGHHSQAEVPLATLYFVDSHGQIPSKVRDPDYDYIKQTQIDWFVRTSQGPREARKGEGDEVRSRAQLSLVFMHIPLPEYADTSLSITGGSRGEPTEGPSYNSHFYKTLAKEGVAAVGCGHDHVNDFCGLLPRRGTGGGDMPQDGEWAPGPPLRGPCLCYGGGSGFGGYCSYGDQRYYRRTRVWELGTKTGCIKTWKRLEYAAARVDELVLVDAGDILVPPEFVDVQRGTNNASAQHGL